MKDLIRKIVKKKEPSSSSLSPPRYSRLSCDHDDSSSSHGRHETRRGCVPVMVGKCEEDEERFMVPLNWMKHPFIVDLLQLSANEFGYKQEGVIQIPCEPFHFRLVMENMISSR
ncbi:Auxin-responsive protein SAUR40 [Bienertia sinuspersici]